MILPLTQDIKGNIFNQSRSSSDHPVSSEVGIVQNIVTCCLITSNKTN